MSDDNSTWPGIFSGGGLAGAAAWAESEAVRVRASIPMQYAPAPNPAYDQLETAEQTHETIRELVELTRANVELTADAQAAADRAEQFTRRTAVISLVVSGVSLLVSIVAVVVTVVLGG